MQAAKHHVDKHCVKQILETAQILCAAFHLQGIGAPYKLTHRNHPVSLWARKSKGNFLWSLKLGKALCAEYSERYGKTHKTEDILNWIAINMNRLAFDELEQTAFAQAMPEEFRNSDPIKAYRNYYKEGKKHLHQWKQNKPSWIG